MSTSDDHLVELLLIPGIGRAKARILYSAGFRSLQELVECPFDELSGIPGIGKSLAYSIRDYAEMMVDVDEEPSDKLETSTGLTMCPMCGSLLGEDTDNCPNCGIAFEGEEEVSQTPAQEMDPDAPDGFWYKEEKSQFFMCPDCGALISEDASKCNNCGVKFDPDMEDVSPETSEVDAESQELADMLVEKADGDIDGHWYKDEAELFLCPNCGSFIPSDAGNCSKCGVVFEADDETADEVAASPDLEVARDPDAPDGYWYKEEKSQFLLCPECGSLISEDAEKCSNCGIKFDMDETEPEIQPDKESEDLMDLLVDGTEKEEKNDDIDGFWYRDKAELFLCPDCGAFISGNASECDTCGLSFTEEKLRSELDKEPLPPETTTSDPDILDMLEEFTSHDEEEVASADEATVPIGSEDEDILTDELTMIADADLDLDDDHGIDDDQIELGTAISIEDGSELKELADMLLHDDELEGGSSDLDELDGHWYKDEVELFLCPNCGSFISSAADSCQYCGIVFEADDGEVEPDTDMEPEIARDPDAPDGFWYKEEKSQFFMCPECGALISEDASSCNNCGVKFDPNIEEPALELDADTEELADMLVEKTDTDLDGHWYKDEAELFLCPNCGAFLSGGASSCDICHAEFEPDGDIPISQLDPSDDVSIDPDEPDGYWYKEEKTQIFLCVECGALLAEDAGKCSNCGAVYDEDLDVEIDLDKEVRAEREIEELSDLLVEVSDKKDAEAQLIQDMEWEESVSELNLCPGCGSFVQAELSECPDCGIIISDAEEVSDELELDIDEPDIITLEDIAVDLDIADVLDGFESDAVSEDDATADAASDDLDERDILGEKLLEDIIAQDDSFDIDGIELFTTETDELELDIDEPILSEIISDEDIIENISLDLDDPIDILIDEEDDDDEPDGDDSDILVDQAEPDPKVGLGSMVDSLADDDTDEELSEMDVLEEMESDLILPELETKEEKRGISKDFLSRWSKLGDEPEEDTKPSGPTDDFIKQFLGMDEDETDDDLSLPDVVDIDMDIGEVIILEDLDALDEKIKEDPDNHIHWARKARLLAKAGSFDEAISCYDKAAELDDEKAPEYKKQILEILHGSVIPDDEDDLLDLELDEAPDPGVGIIKARLIDIDKDLELFPGTESLLMEKGELLDKLGLHEAALECYDQVIHSSYEEIEAESLKKTGKTPAGLINGTGRVNGKVNGRAVGTVDGRVNGKTNGHVNGRTNGHAFGKTNGRVNGKTNGRTNGLVNGRVIGGINGLVNGRVNGLVNGRVNGLINGSGGMINGHAFGTTGHATGSTNGLINGRLSGLVNGRVNGLVNGMGLINGDALANNRGRAHRKNIKSNASSAWRMRVTMMAALIFIMLFLPILTNSMIGDDTYGMDIDGDFSEWREFTSYHDSSIDQISNDDLNIIETRVNFRPPNMYFYIMVEGDLLGGSSSDSVRGLDSVFIFIDTDSDTSTGYEISNMGADVLLDVQGWGNRISEIDLKRFNNDMDHNDWNAFEYSHEANAAVNDNEMEIRVILDELTPSSQPSYAIMMQDSFGHFDISDSVISPLRGTLRASMSEAVDSDIIQPGDHDASLLLLESFGLDSDVEGLAFSSRGELGYEEMIGLRLVVDEGNQIYDASSDQVLETTMTGDGGDFTINFDRPLTIEAGERVSIFLIFDIPVSTDAPNVGVYLTDVLVPDGIKVHIAENSGAVHNIGDPENIEIDGAFGDWLGIGSNIDAANDVVGASDTNTSRINRNVDIGDYRMSVDDRLLIYTSLSGVAMGGMDVPTIRYRPGIAPVTNVSPITPAPLPDSDNDGVPNNIDGPNGSYAYDFNNDGIDDQNSNGDIDGDGVIDYNNDGPDMWLNTTIPLDFDPNYSGNFISRYIGPIGHVEIIGQDYLSIFIDSDNDVSTGDYKGGILGADHMVLIAGRNNKIISSELFTYLPTNSIPWEYIGTISSDLDYHRMEMGIPLSMMGLNSMDEFSVFIEISDWKHSIDQSDDTMSHNAQAPSGTRSAPPGDVPLPKPPPVPQVSVSKDADLRTAEPGDYISYTITLENKRNSATSAYVWLNDTLPTGVTYISDTSGISPTINGQTYTYPFTNLAGGTTITFDIVVQVDDTVADGTNLVNNVDVDFTDAAGVPYGSDSDSASTECARPDITIVKVANTTTAAPGTEVVYTIWYNNTGGAPANVWINDTIPAGTTYVSSSSAPDSIVVDDYSWYFPNVRKNTVNSLTITVLVDALAPAGTITNWASLNYTSPGGYQFAEQSDSATITVVIIPEFSSILPLALGIMGITFIGFRRKEKKEVNE